MKNDLNSKILVTGGSGFIGTYMIKCLKKHGYTNITVLDVLPPKVEGVSFVESDFGNKILVRRLLKDVKYVFHFAAMVGVDKCRLDPEGVNRVNYQNTKELIDLCIESGVERFVFSSSSEVYGNSIDIPYREDATLYPISEYAKCKFKVEQYLKEVQEKSIMTAGIVRFFNIYGVGQKKDFVVPLFIDKALSSAPLTILGDGKQTRCFTYVEDAVEGVYKVFKYTDTPYEIFNIGNPNEYSISELAKVILECTPQSKSNIVNEDYGNGIREAFLEINRRVPATEKAEKLLSFKAKIALKEGIKKVISNTLGS